VAVAGLVAVFPFAAGLGVFLDPLRRRSGEGNGAANGDSFLPVCPLDQLPDDGVPRRFAIMADVIDAWTRRPGQPVGAVYLVRAAADTDPQVTAFTTACPHLGCAVEFNPSADQFECPCHKSGFATDGQQLFGPSRRGLDSLDVKLEPHFGQMTIWVDYQRFRTGIAMKEPIA
jgi:nitrite reductase/ring-hydroxylating ferredoxin subunit